MADLIGRMRRYFQQNPHRRRLPRPRLFRDRFNPLEMRDDDELYERYRFRRPTIIFIVDLIENYIHHPTRRSLSLPSLIQVLVFLRFVATGAFHQVVGDSIHISKSTAGRCIRRVAAALVRFSGRYIKFPTGQDAVNVKRNFHAIAGFPGILGCIDGTFIRIQTPKENEQDFVNRKGYHSLNVQMTCDSNFLVTNCVARWPGSCHDSRIFRESKLCEQFENGQHDGLLLGDSAYPCKTYLMTPFNTTNDVHYREKFNRALCRTRVLIEQTYGILKRRFPCLSVGLRTNPDRACMYVVACVMLHNIGILRQDIVTTDINDLVIAGPDIEDNLQLMNQNGFGYREYIARQFFN
ncbi:putative nuclease HARBI1 [Saccostrea cucullata]|uniref:putative nuclease HARBI1 n=1 Tax=Saccostrea cuccullata TaxID=36930 RepID=UPI002ED04299